MPRKRVRWLGAGHDGPIACYTSDFLGKRAVFGAKTGETDVVHVSGTLVR